MKRLLLVLPLLALAACGEGDVTELSRQTSPDGAWDVIMARVQATKGKDSPTMVLIGAKGVGNGKAARVFLADHVTAPEVAWDSEKQITIRCEKARVWNYHNFFNAPNGNVAVAIKLACGTEGWVAEAR
ncbi:MAG: hypothetical protein AB1918_08625 [Pseudomonadota bacterium]